MTEREQFEAWWYADTRSALPDGEQDIAWRAWQAARAAAPDALENCRLYAARHRKEEWAQTILRFCAEAGVTGSPLRAAAPLLRPYQVLRAAVDAMMAPLGYHGTISARDDRVQAVMDALSQIDEVERAREALT